MLSLWVVPPDRWFVFPTGPLGRTVRVPRVPQAPFDGGDEDGGAGVDRAIVVETISNEPRVFHLHNFLTAGESDLLVAHALADTDSVTGLQRSTTGAEHQVKLDAVIGGGL